MATADGKPTELAELVESLVGLYLTAPPLAGLVIHRDDQAGRVRVGIPDAVTAEYTIRIVQ